MRAPTGRSSNKLKKEEAVLLKCRHNIDPLELAPHSNSYAAYQELFMANLPADPGLFNEYHALLVRLAKEICRPRPLCQQCCLNIEAKTSQENAYGQYPCAAITRRRR
jgi:endonuclease-3 related protein